MFCENCGLSHNGSYGSGRFCGVKCCRGFSTKARRKEINSKVAEKLTGKKLSDEHIKRIEESTNFNRKKKTKKNCLNCSIQMLCRPSDKRKFCTRKCWVEHTEKTKEPFDLYKQQCNFEFDPKDYPDKFNLTLVKQRGWYSPSNKGNNLNGVSKDHMFSVKDGFELKVDPEIIKHPANCELMLHRQNQKKNTKSSITLNELLKKIANW